MALTSSQRVLITGAHSQLAQCIQKIIVKYPEILPTFFTKAQLDITSEQEINACLEEQTYDYCINCAAYTAVDKAEDDERLAYAINATGVKNLALACKRFDIELIHISTDFVFDGSKNTPYSEEDQPNPLNVYGQSKLKGEEEIRSFLSKHFIIRTSWLYSEYGNNFVKTMLRLSDNKDKLSVVSDQVGSPTYAGDLAKVIIKLINTNSQAYGLYHFANKGEVSWYEFAKEIFKQANKSVSVEAIMANDFNSKAIRPNYSVLECSKITTELNVEPQSWSKALSQYFHSN